MADIRKDLQDVSFFAHSDLLPTPHCPAQCFKVTSVLLCPLASCQAPVSQLEPRGASVLRPPPFGGPWHPRLPLQRLSALPSSLGALPPFWSSPSASPGLLHFLSAAHAVCKEALIKPPQVFSPERGLRVLLAPW